MYGYEHIGKGTKYAIITEEGGPYLERIVVEYYKSKADAKKDINRFKEQGSPEYSLWKLEELG